MQVIPIRKQAVDTNPVLSEYLDARAHADIAQQRLKNATDALTAEMAEHHQKSLSITRDGIKRTVTYTTRSIFKVDEPGLRKALTAKIYDKYTTKKLDQKALEDAMGTGAVDPMVVSKYITTNTSAAYLRFSEKVESDE